ncbi:PP2C family protein-serine/threonine phosphatase [Phytoactinopolyspora halotolerans]|uniref:Serine/threonine protein phosphatase PstP n=1 Tax=Phytoactinopolyspora halotolerans TaxID=1981512 RepID=A0A6L9S0V7_9ACTN|nr:PP2C family serine/threonine-protein phosphatase [Phytoactinopolyspora halotolerans]NED98722.1 serine/threonine-protein phosphatase [Phytoactinopolyspora halotolerans]
MPLMLRYVARSDVGLIREGNEDSGYAGPRLLAVADGMGGHAAGEVASQAAIEELIAVEDTLDDDDPRAALSSAIQAANNRIRQLIADDPAREGMGTTVTALLWTGSALCMGHIGDSRAYLLRDGAITQLSHDHTFVQSLVDEGRISLEEAGVHPARSLILKALQGQGPVEPDLEMIDIVPGDRLLVCSDGLSGVVSDDTLAETLASVDQLDAAADELIRLALSGGAPDNVTLIVADVVETAIAPSPDDTAESYLVGAAAGDHAPQPERPHRRRPAAALRVLLGGEEKPADPEELEALRYAPRPPRKYRWVRPVVLLLIVALAAWGGLALANDWVRSQYYVGQNSGEVAIFQGVSQEIGFISLSRLHEIPDGLPVDALPGIYQDQVEGTITADSIEDAKEIVSTLRRQACRAAGALEPEPDPDPTDTPDPTDRPDPTGTPDPTGSPNPGASRSPNAANPGPTATQSPNTNTDAAGTGAAAGTPAPTGTQNDNPRRGQPSGTVEPNPNTSTPAGETDTDDSTSEDGWVSTDGRLDCTGVR